MNSWIVWFIVKMNYLTEVSSEFILQHLY